MHDQIHNYILSKVCEICKEFPDETSVLVKPQGEYAYKWCELQLYPPFEFYSPRTGDDNNFISIW